MVSLPHWQVYVPRCQPLFIGFILFIVVEQTALNTKVKEEMPCSLRQIDKPQPKAAWATPAMGSSLLCMYARAAEATALPKPCPPPT